MGLTRGRGEGRREPTEMRSLECALPHPALHRTASPTGGDSPRGDSLNEVGGVSRDDRPVEVAPDPVRGGPSPTLPLRQRRLQPRKDHRRKVGTVEARAETDRQLVAEIALQIFERSAGDGDSAREVLDRLRDERAVGSVGFLIGHESHRGALQLPADLIVCVASSALMGTISGSGIANVVTSGQFTIPLMKKYGYSPAFAGGVEATSSMGGQIMPPVMGAVAFIMAETLGVKYIEIVKAAIIPAILYYIACWWMVYLEAGKKNLLGIPKEQLPSAYQAIKKNWYLTIPLIVLVYLLFSGFTPLYAGTIGLAFVVFLILGAPIAGKLTSYKRVLFWIILGLVSASFFEIGIKVIVISISILVFINFIFRGGRETLLACRDALAEGGKAALPVGVACAVIGVVIGTLTLTGAANTFGQYIIKVGENSLLLSLILTMIVCLILGMGIPTIPNYIITSAIAGPALLKLGVPLLISHMFVFYFGIMADLTPPVALACFAAAPFAKESGFKISLQAVKLAVAGFVVPFMAVYSPELMLQGLENKDVFTIITSVSYITIKALIAMLFLGMTAVGYMNAPLNIIERIICFCVSILLIAAIPITDELGFGLMIIFIIYRWFKFRRINPNTQ